MDEFDDRSHIPAVLNTRPRRLQTRRWSDRVGGWFLRVLGLLFVVIALCFLFGAGLIFTGRLNPETTTLPGARWGMAFLILFTLFWCFCTGLLVMEVYIRPWQLKRLHRRGHATPGVITDRQVDDSGENRTYTLSYSFRVNDRYETAKMTVHADDYYAAKIGQQVAVLHWPRRSKPSTIYGLGDYTCT